MTGVYELENQHSDHRRRWSLLSPRRRAVLEAWIRGEFDDDETPDDSPVQPISLSGSRLPLFCVHPTSGAILCYAELARHLGSDQPMYGLQAVGLDGRGTPHTRIEDMATVYAGALVGLQSQGPYYLAGWSLGGIVAYEMARQLSNQGHEVALLALIDSLAPVFGWIPTVWDDVDALVYLLQELNPNFVTNVESISRDLRGLVPDQQLQYVWERIGPSNFAATAVGIQEIRNLMRIIRANLQALGTYRPKAYAGKVILIRASEQTRAVSEQPTLGWDLLVSGEIEVHPMPGDHYSMVRPPHVVELALLLGRYLDGV